MIGWFEYVDDCPAVNRNTAGHSPIVWENDHFLQNNKQE